MKIIFEIFLSIFKIGAFTFGGGYAMIPLIEQEVVNNKKWLNKDEFMDVLVVAPVSYTHLDVYKRQQWQ